MDRVVGGRRGWVGALALGVLAAGAALPAAAQTAPHYSIVELSGVPQQINNGGAVAGWIYVGSAAHAAIYSGGSWRDLGVLSGDQLAVLNGINNLGAGVGFSFAALPPPPGSTIPDNRWQAILAPAGASAVQSLSSIAPDSFAYAINDGGAIVGCLDRYDDEYPDPHRAYIYANGVVTELHTLLTRNPMYDFTCAHDINGTGLVVGEVDSNGVARGFMYQNGAATILDQGARFMTTARAVNASGRIVGDGQLAGWSADQALTYDSASATFTSVGVEATGAYSSQGNDINLGGAVVGSMQLNVGQHAFLATGGHVYDLNDLIPAGSGWVLQTAVSINDGGQIVGSGTLASDPSSSPHYFLLDASAPAPSIDGLIAQVRALEAAHFLSHGNATSLIAQLQAAARHLSGRCSRLAVLSLESFVRQVDMLMRTGRLSPTKGQPLVDQANRIIDALLAPPPPSPGKGKSKH